MGSALKIGLSACFVAMHLFALSQEARKGMSLEVNADHTSYRIGDDIKMNLEFRNNGRVPVFILTACGPESPWIYFSVIGTPQNQEIRWPLLCDIVLPPKEKDFTKVNPGEILKVRASIPVTYLVKRAGTYELISEFTEAVDKILIRDYLKLPVDEVWTKENGSIVSNHIRIIVTK